MQLAVGRIVRAHGIRGEVTVDVRTDDPGERFAGGRVLATDPPEAGPLTVASARWHSGRLLVAFAGIEDRDQAELLRGTWLTVDSAEVPGSAGPDEFHDQELIGLRVVTTGGEPVGAVTDVRHHGQDLLVIEPAAGQEPGELLVPFVAAIAVEVDVAAGRLVIDPPPGLLDLRAGPAGRG
jgi:16S rRNA processing protein RimM